MSKSYTIILTDAEDKAFRSVAFSPQEWIENVTKNRCAVAINEIVKAEVDKKLAAGETISGSKEDIVLAANIIALADMPEPDLAQMPTT